MTLEHRIEALKKAHYQGWLCPELEDNDTLARASAYAKFLGEAAPVEVALVALDLANQDGGKIEETVNRARHYFAFLSREQT